MPSRAVSGDRAEMHHRITRPTRRPLLHGLVTLLAISGVFLLTLESEWWLPFEQPVTELIRPASGPSSSLLPLALFGLGTAVAAGGITLMLHTRATIAVRRRVTVIGGLLIFASLHLAANRYGGAEDLSLRLVGDEAPWGLRNTTGSGTTTGPIADPWPSISAGSTMLIAAVALMVALDRRRRTPA